MRACYKLTMANLSRPAHRASTHMLHRLGGLSSTSHQLSYLGRIFAEQGGKLRNETKQHKQFARVCMGGQEVGHDRRKRMLVNCYTSLQAEANITNFRITSDCRDPRDEWIERWRIAETKEAGQQKFGERMAVIRSIEQLKDFDFGSEPGAMPLLDVQNNLRKLDTWKKKIKYMAGLSSALSLSRRHQAECERLIALLKKQQQQMDSMRRGIIHIGSNVIRIKLFHNLEDMEWLRDEGEDNEEMEAVAQEQKFLDELTDLQYALLHSENKPSRYTVFRRETGTAFEKTVDEVDPNFTEAKKGALRRRAAEQLKEQAQLKETRERLSRDDGFKANCLRVERSDRADPQLRFYEELHKLALQKYAGGGKNGGWNWKDLQHRMRQQYESLVLPSKQIVDYDGLLGAHLHDRHYVPPSGIERLVGWIIACKSKKKDWWALAKFLDTDPEVDEEYIRLQQELGESVPAVDEAWEKFPSALLAVELEEGAEGLPKIVVVHFVMRSPFLFVGASAKRRGASELVVDDVLEEGGKGIEKFSFVSSRQSTRMLLRSLTGQKVKTHLCRFDDYNVASLLQTIPIVVPRADSVKVTTAAPVLEGGLKADGSADEDEDEDEEMPDAVQDKPEVGEASIEEPYSSDDEGAVEGGVKIFRLKTLKEGRDAAGGTKKKTKPTAAPKNAAEPKKTQPQGAAGVYDVLSEKERKQLLRRERLQLFKKADVPGFEIDVRMVGQVQVRPTIQKHCDWLRRLVLQDQAEIEVNGKTMVLDFRKHFAMRSTAAVRYFSFDPAIGPDPAYWLAAAWAKRTSLLFEVMSGSKKSRAALLAELKPYSDQLEIIPLDAIQDGARALLSDIPEECIKFCQSAGRIVGAAPGPAKTNRREEEGVRQSNNGKS
eukprot:g4321.t1